MFGTSGRIEHDPEQLTIEQYTVCWDKMYNEGKVIINTGWEFTRMYMHWIAAKGKVCGRTVWIPPVNEFGKFIRWENIHRTGRNVTSEDFTMQPQPLLEQGVPFPLQIKRTAGAACPGYRHSMKQFFNSEHRQPDSRLQNIPFSDRAQAGLGNGPQRHVMQQGMTENTSGADTSYEQALKSTGIVGGAQFLTILITVVKTKIVALLLGPAGVGVLGLLRVLST